MFLPTSSASRHPTNPHPRTTDSALTTALSTYQHLGVATSTRRTYNTALLQFRSFCSKYHITPFPASPLTIRYFCAYLAHFQHLKHGTIKTYLAGIQLHHIESGHADPTNDELVHYLCTGIKRLQGATKRTGYLSLLTSSKP